MTLEEAKDILMKEGFCLVSANKVVNQAGAIREFEKPEVSEAIKVANANKWNVGLTPTEWGEREARLKKEYAKNHIKCGEPITYSPALAEAASQFNDALLDEQAKKIAELTKENERLERVCKTTTDEFNKLYYRMITKSDKIAALGKEIAKLNDIIHDKNMELKRKTKGCCELITENVDLKKKLSDKDAVLSDVAEELRLSKIREKNLTEVCQKYVKETEELKKKLADKVVDKINANALKSAESALAYKEKVIADLGKELKRQKALADHISKKYDGAKINLKVRTEGLERLEKKLEEKTKLVEWVRNASKEYCDYGVAANEFIKELAGLYVLANNNGIINDEMLERCKNYQTYGFPANCNRETKKEIDNIAIGKENKKPSFFRDDSVGAVTNLKDCSPAKDTHSGVDIAEEGGDNSGVIVLFGKDFIDAIKKMK